MRYQRTQSGFPIIALIVAAIAVVIWVLFTSADTGQRGAVWLIVVPVSVVLLGSALIFSSMTIRVGQDRIDWWLGFHIVHGTVLLDDVTGCTPKRLSLLTGLGLRTADFTNWIIIVSGRTAVDVRLRSGKYLVLGSPDPERLCEVVSAARAARPMPSDGDKI